MTEQVIEQAVTSPDPTGTPEASPEEKGTAQPDEITQARRRQAGAEAARQEAERQLKEARAENERLKGLVPAVDPAKPVDPEFARLTAQAAAAEKRAEEAETKALAKVLDAKFPNARKELPEVTDEVRLAKFEAMLSDGDDTPTPRGNNAPRAGNRAPAKPETIAEVEARLATMVPPWQQPAQ